MCRVVLAALLLVFAPVVAFSQSLQILVPRGDVLIQEGDSVSIQLAVHADSVENPTGVEWRVDYTTLPEGTRVWIDEGTVLRFFADWRVAGPTAPQVRVPVRITAADTSGRDGSAQLSMLVQHINRPPVVGDIPPGYARPDEPFVFDFKQVVHDPDGDRLRFSIPSLRMPEAATLTPEGVFTWRLSTPMYRQLPHDLEVAATDGNETVQAVLQIRRTQAGLPPQITLLGNQGEIVLREGGQVALHLDVYDPNGVEDITNVATTTTLPYNNYRFVWPVGNDRSRAEFVFMPGYDFIDGPGKTRVGEVTFTAMDQDRKTAQPVTIKMTVSDIPDPAVLFRDYRASLEMATGVLTQLSSQQDLLERRLSRVRTSERVRRVFTTLLGMSTTAFSIFADGDLRKYGAGVSGIVTTGLGGLEAGRIFTSTEPIDRQLQDVKTEILRIRFESETLARSYSLPESRLSASFNQDRRTLEKLVLDARTKLKITEDPPKVSDEEIKRYTVYFSGQ